MSKIFITITGNGNAWVDDDNPEPYQVVTLYAMANDPDTLTNIIATDSYDYPIAMSVAPTQQFQFNPSWNKMYIEVTFTGATPPQPPSNLYWLLFKAANKWRMKT